MLALRFRQRSLKLVELSPLRSTVDSRVEFSQWGVEYTHSGYEALGQLGQEEPASELGFTGLSRPCWPKAS